MNNNYLAAENMYKYKKHIMIVALTGRTGSGCSTTASILKRNEMQNLDLRKPKTYEFNNSDERKYRVVYQYIQKNDNWLPFTIIEGSSIILSFIFEKGYSQFVEYLERIDNSKECKVMNFNQLKKDLAALKDAFTESCNYKLDKSVINIQEKDLEKYYEYLINTISKYKQLIHEILNRHSCCIAKDNSKRAHLYTYLMQTWGNNIRASGDPYVSQFTQINYYDIAVRIDFVISIILRYQEKEHGKFPNIRICIDALRNTYEALYFRDKYENFKLIAISTDEEIRVSRFSHLGKEERDAIDKIESPIKFDKPEEQFYHQNIQGCVEISDIHIYNPNVENNKYYFLTEQLLKYIALMSHPGLITPTHIERCMQLAYNAKFNSGCLSRQVGAVISSDDFSVKAIGWNDVPKGQVPCNLRDAEGYCKNKDIETYSEFERCDANFDMCINAIYKEIQNVDMGGRLFPYCFKDIYNGFNKKDNAVYTRSLHAEENAFLQIAKYGGSGIQGGFLFTTASPCELCAKKAYQLGISRIYYIDPYPGISLKHILTFGEKDNPKMNVFYGAIGNAYISLYEPRMSMKDELALVSGLNCKEYFQNNNFKEIDQTHMSDLEYEYIKCDFEYTDKAKIIYKKKVRFKVIGSPINHLSKNIPWTGSKYEGSELFAADPNFEFEDSVRQKPPFKYNVAFNRNIMRGESVEFEVQTKLSDVENEMQPYLSHTITNVTNKKLKMVIFTNIHTK